MLDKMILPRFSGLHDSLTVFGRDLHNLRTEIVNVGEML